MPTLQFEHPITDYTTWKAAFDRDPIDRRALGVRSYRIHRPLDRPNYILGELDFDTTVQAEACATALEQLWRSRQAAPALAGAAQVRIVATVESHQYNDTAP